MSIDVVSCQVRCLLVNYFCKEIGLVVDDGKIDGSVVPFHNEFLVDRNWEFR